MLYFYTNSANKISLLVFGLLIVQPGFLDLFFLYNWYALSSTFNSAVNYTTTISTSPASFPLVGAQIWTSLVGVDLLASDTTFELGLSVTCTLKSTTSVKAVIQGLTKKSFTLNSIYFIFFVYNKNQMLALSPAANYTVGSFSGTNAVNSQLLVNDAANVFRNFNTIIGLTGFYISGDNFFNYQCSIIAGVSASATSTNNWLAFSFNYFNLQFYYCPDLIPYLMVSTNLCYDLCPMRYCSNASDYQCDACPTYDCYYCAYTGLCSQCNATLDFRYMSNTSRCIPLPGYYDSGASQAVPCIASNCLTCTSAVICTSCPPGKFLTSSKTCGVCPVNCLNCSSTTICVVCATYYKVSLGTCIPDCSSILNCSTCSVTSGNLSCLTCALGYSLVSNACIQVCGDGMLLSPEVCDDGNILNGDGCSSNCSIETSYYCVINSTTTLSACSLCTANCLNCTSAAVCTVCSPNYLVSGSLCTLSCANISFCSTCIFNTSLVCSSCSAGYSVVNNTCMPVCGDGVIISP